MPADSPPIPRERPGDRIGRYELLQQLGEGGFGAVWMAAQHEPVRRRVALKILKLGMDTRQVVARFEQERQALALMDHPSIARVFDAGATEEGRPYFVMELVEGVPILEYCDTRRLDPRARLAIFVDVCRAIQHAHQKGIIHRDIKPSNVLVTMHDGRPLPKVIDFGIAKAIDAERAGATLFTEQGQIIGTPAYMAPEQVAGSSLDIDTRADVYGLGVLLYELLTGTTPFDVRELMLKGIGEMLRIIREVEPRKPSTRVSSLGDTAAWTAERRSVDARRLQSLLRGDLDWIVMRCLEKDRARRYESASGLALDVERHLAGLAVEAAPPSASYRLRKLVRRNRGAVAAGTLVLLALVAGLLGTLWQARAERQRAGELEQVARFQAEMLSRIDPSDAGAALRADLRGRFLASLEKAGTPEEERLARAAAFERELGRVNATDAAVTLIDRTILEPAVAATSREFHDQPRIDASLRQTLADLRLRLGRARDGQDLQAEALAIRRRELGDDDPATIGSILGLGHYLRAQGSLEDAEGFYREALERSRRVRGSEDPLTLLALSNVGGILRARGRLDEAEPCLREVMDTRRRLLGEEHPMTLEAISSLGGLVRELGRTQEAAPYYREVLEKRRRVLGEEHRDTIESIGSMSIVLRALGKPAEAEPYLREALEKSRKVLGEEHPRTIGALADLGTYLLEQGRLAEAESLLLEHLESARRVFGEDHPESLAAQFTIGVLLRKQGRLAEAESRLRESLAERRRVLGNEHRQTLSSIGQYSAVLNDLRRYAESEPLCREAVETSRRVFGEDHPDTLTAWNDLTFALSGLGKLDEAEAIQRELLLKRRRLLGDDHPNTVAGMTNLGSALFQQGRFAEAEPLLREALERNERVLGTDHGNTVLSRNNLASLLVELRRFEESEALYRPAVAGFERQFGKDHLRTGQSRIGFGRALTGLGRFPEAEVELVESERVLSSAQGVPPALHRKCVTALVALYEAWDAAEPGSDRGTKAVEWKARMDAGGR